MKYLAYLLLILLTSCEEPNTSSPSKTLEKKVWIKINNSIYINEYNIEVGFQKIKQDSRCPSDVICVWEGVAETVFWLLKPGSDTIYFNLSIFGYVFQADTQSHNYIDISGYRFILMQLDPYPSVQNPINPKDYIALLKISKLQIRKDEVNPPPSKL